MGLPVTWKVAPEVAIHLSLPPAPKHANPNNRIVRILAWMRALRGEEVRIVNAVAAVSYTHLTLPTNREV